MTYKQILLSLLFALVQLFVVAGLVWVFQPKGAEPIALGTRPATPQAAATPPQQVPAPIAAPAPVAAPTPTVPAAAASTMPPHPLTLVSWGGSYQDSLREAVFDPFSADTGHAYAEDTIGGTLAEVKQALRDGRTWDVVNLEFADMLRGCEEGVFEALDWSRIANTQDFIPSAVETCGVGSVVWDYVMAYAPGKVPRPAVSWNDFWDVAGMPGQRGMRNLAQWNLEVALMADGVSTREVYSVLDTPQGVDRAFAKLDQIKPYVSWWSAGAEPIGMIARDEVVMTTAYNGRLTIARQEGIDVTTVWNNVVYTLDYWSIVKGTPNMASSYDFLAYTARPETMARLANMIPNGPTNTKAMPLVDAKMVPELPTTPANLRFAVLSDANFWNRHGPALEERFKRWMGE